ncbi:DUF2332 domain-containing protein [Paenibacillus tarimensis]
MALDTNGLAERFKRFANRECRGSSKLYERLSVHIADDEELLHIACHAGPGQPVPNLFLAAVHYLLLKGKEHVLQAYYPSIVDDPKDPETAFVWFKDFCLNYTNELIPLLQNKLVQTNEVRRCAYLYPSFCYIYEQTKKPLALIELGTSAGLQLLWDKYRYTYNSGEMYGNVYSELDIACEMRGEGLPFFLNQSPPVSSRIGLDLHVNNLNNPEDYLWLKSLIWPEHKERIVMFQKAARCLRGESVELIEGNGVRLMSEVASKIQEDHTVCIFHTHVANQLSKVDKTELLDRIQQLGRSRKVFHLYNNLWDEDLHLDCYVDGELDELVLAETDGHGRWFEWKL